MTASSTARQSPPGEPDGTSGRAASASGTSGSSRTSFPRRTPARPANRDRHACAVDAGTSRRPPPSAAAHGRATARPAAAARAASTSTVMITAAPYLRRDGGGGGGELRAGGGGVAGSGVGPGGDDEDQGVIDGAAPRVAFTVGVVLSAAVRAAGSTQGAEGDGVAAGFCQEVAAAAEHVRPAAEPRIAGRVLAAELPGGGDHPLEMRGTAQGAQVKVGADARIGQAGHGQRFGGVLGDVVGHRWGG